MWEIVHIVCLSSYSKKTYRQVCHYVFYIYPLLLEPVLTACLQCHYVCYVEIVASEKGNRERLFLLLLQLLEDVLFKISAIVLPNDLVFGLFLYKLQNKINETFQLRLFCFLLLTLQDILALFNNLYS